MGFSGKKKMEKQKVDVAALKVKKNGKTKKIIKKTSKPHKNFAKNRKKPENNKTRVKFHHWRRGQSE